MKRSIFFLLLSFLLLDVSAQTRLELNLKAGETYRQSTSNNASVTQNIMGQEITINLGIKGIMDFKVINELSDSYDMEVAFQEMSLNMGSLQGSQQFSSENPDETDTFSKILSGMTGQTFSVRMSKKGTILEIDNVEELWEAAFRDQNVSEAEKAQILTQLMQTYGPESIKGNIEMVTAIFPDNEVKLGDQWTNEVNLATGMKGLATTTYLYESQQGNFNLISGKGTITTGEEDAYMETNGMKLKMDLNGDMRASIIVDAESGWIVDATINQDINGSATMEGNAQMPGGLTIPMKVTNEMTITN